MKLEELVQKAPDMLRPTNIGKYDEVAWPFFYTLKFTLPSGPDNINISNFSETKAFQVSQEGAFVLTSIESNLILPFSANNLAINIRDRQSTRQMSEQKIPLIILANPKGLELPVSQIFFPNTFVEVTLSCIESFSTLDGNTVSFWRGQNQELSFTFSGYRVRVNQFGEIQSPVMG